MKDEDVKNKINQFRLPRYAELPSMGLYLEQVTKYINERLAVLGDVNLTGSMIGNYVKHQIIDRPQKKQYGREQIADFIFIALAKNVLRLEDLRMGIEIQQKSSFNVETAYDYFCEELENVLRYIFGCQASLETVGKAKGEQKRMLRNLIMTISYKVYLDAYFQRVKEI